MLELSTLPVSRAVLGQFIALARAKKGVAFRAGAAYQTLKAQTIPDLGAYIVPPQDNITIDGVGVDDISYGTFWAVCRGLRSTVRRCEMSIELAESGKVHNVGETYDLCGTVGFNDTGLRARAQVCAKDMEYRCRVFNAFIDACGRNGTMRTVHEDGKLFVRSDSMQCESASNLDRGLVKQVAAEGRLYQYDGANCYDGRKVTNFSTLMIYMPDVAGGDEMPAPMRGCIDWLRGFGRLLQSDISVSLHSTEYQKVADVLGGFVVPSRWEVQLKAVPKYGVDSLDKMLAETESLLLPLFMFKDRRAGEIDVELYHSKGALTLFFSSAGDDVEVEEKAIRSLVAELSAGEAVIDESAT